MGAGGSYAEQAFVEFYDHVVPYRERQDVGFFVERARETGGPVLELGCGTGRVLIPTAQAGLEIVGLDSSPLMLSACRRKLAAEAPEVQSRVELVEGDMRRFELGREFRLVTIPFRPFQHLLTVEDQLSCLTSIHRHLASNGWLIVDVFNPDLARLVDEQFLKESAGEPEFVMPDGRRVVRRDRVVARDLAQQWQDIELIYYVWHPDGREERLVYPSRMRYFFRFELEHLLGGAGFRVEEVYSDYDRTPYGSKVPGELIVVAQKG